MKKKPYDPVLKKLAYYYSLQVMDEGPRDNLYDNFSFTIHRIIISAKIEDGCFFHCVQTIPVPRLYNNRLNIQKELFELNVLVKLNNIPEKVLAFFGQYLVSVSNHFHN